MISGQWGLKFSTLPMNLYVDENFWENPGSGD